MRGGTERDNDALDDELARTLLTGLPDEVADVVLDLTTRQLKIGDRSESLSPREFDILELLCRRKGRVVAKRALEDHLFGLDGELGSNAVEVYVHRVRKRLADVGTKAQVHTIRGVGYMISES